MLFLAAANPIPVGDPTIGGYIALMGLGFLIGIAGHVVRSNLLVGIGIAMVFAAVIVLPLIFQGG